MLTKHVIGQNHKIYTSKAQAEADCEAIRKLNPHMKVLVCTPLGTPVRVAKPED